MNQQLGLFILATIILNLCWHISLNTPRPFWWERERVENSPLRQSYQSNHLAELVRSYSTGNKSRLQPTMRRLHQDLGLMHLLTPSGLHLSVLWKIMISFVAIFISINFKWRLFLSTASVIILLPISSLLAMQRMAILRLISTALSPFIQNKTRKTQISFIATFVIALIIGNFSASPLSFALSFLFLAMLISAQSYSQMVAGLFVSQALVQSLFLQAFSPLAALMGIIIITPLFILLFPLFLMEYWAFRFISGIELEFLFQLYLQLLQKLHKVAEITPYAHYDQSFAIAAAFIFLGKTLKIKIIGCLILISATKPIYNIPTHAYLEEVRIARETRHRLYFPPENISRTKRGYKTWDQHQTCYHRILVSTFQRQCRNH